MGATTLGRSRSLAERAGRTSARRIARGLLTLLVVVAPVRATAETTTELVDGFVLLHDGAGSFRLERGDTVSLEVELRWFDAAGGPADGTPLTVASGWRPEAGDENSVARRAPLGRELHVRTRHWRYFHVDPVAFVDARMVGPEGAEPAGAAGLSVRAPAGWTRRTLTRRPHLAIGRAPRVEFEILETTIALDTHERRHLGVVRLDRRRAVVQADGSTLLWEAGTPPTWPLALIVARSRSSLEYLAGQALVTYDQAGGQESPAWKVPPMCGRCRDPRIEELRVDLSLRDRRLRVLASTPSLQRVHPVSWESLRLEGVPLNVYDRGPEGSGRRYEIPVSSTLALDLARASVDGSLRAEIWMDAGVGVEPDDVVVIAPARLDETIEALAPAHLVDELPSYLSPALVTNWPNPFRDATMIEVEVPSTLGEAFELEPSIRRRVDPSAPPPFGPRPMVRVKVYNVSGQLVDLLDEEIREPGRFTVHWNGSDAQGRPVAAGAYYVNVEMGDWSVTKRVLRIRN
jgi:hypothetical protein